MSVHRAAGGMQSPAVQWASCCDWRDAESSRAVGFMPWLPGGSVGAKFTRVQQVCLPLLAAAGVTRYRHKNDS